MSTPPPRPPCALVGLRGSARAALRTQRSSFSGYLGVALDGRDAHAEGVSYFDGGHPSLFGLDYLLAQVLRVGVDATMMRQASSYLLQAALEYPEAAGSGALKLPLENLLTAGPGVPVVGLAGYLDLRVIPSSDRSRQTLVLAPKRPQRRRRDHVRRAHRRRRPPRHCRARCRTGARRPRLAALLVPAPRPDRILCVVADPPSYR